MKNGSNKREVKTSAGWNNRESAVFLNDNWMKKVKNAQVQKKFLKQVKKKSMQKLEVAVA